MPVTLISLAKKLAIKEAHSKLVLNILGLTSAVAVREAVVGGVAQW